MTRGADRALFLTGSGWDQAEIQPLAGDASSRSYYRIHQASRSAILMDVADDPTGSLPRFLAIGSHLSRIGLHPPAVLSVDREKGLLLLEDLGDELFARVMSRDAALELPLYRTAIDVLVAVQTTSPPDLPEFGPAVMAEAAGLAARSYAGRQQDAGTLSNALRPLLDRIEVTAPVMIMRDYHAENLVWCPGSAGLMRVGLLDFQDAMIGHPVYDIVSLLQDARRDVSAETSASLKAYAQSLPNWSGPGFEFAFAVLGAQRALRILGVFARLSLAHGKPGYIDLIPRVWDLMARNLEHPELSDLAGIVRRILPEPDASHISDLKARCQNLPTP